MAAPSPNPLRIPLRMALTVTLLLLLCCLAGCSSTPAPGPPIPGYLGFQEDFDQLELRPLAGRRILIDPGHGGFFRGAVGPGGLTEAEVNLGVALYLRGLLEWAGAEAPLTRTADTDFLSPADSTLAHDLGFRVSIIDSLQPDVFISIHHNSTASRDPDINETQTYYPLGDEGASLDLARSIHRHLVKNLDIHPAKILPGNFRVLRDSPVPSVLGEPAMISNPVIEGRLSLARSHELEAKAYFLGLLSYFAAGLPHWTGVPGDTLVVAPEGPPGGLVLVFEADTTARPSAPGPAPSSFVVRLDGRPQGFDLSPDGRQITWRPSSPLAPGCHHLEIQGRNLKGRATPVRRLTLHVESAPLLDVAILEGSQHRLLRWRTAGDGPIPSGFLEGDAGTNLPLPPGDQGWFLLEKDIRDKAWSYRRRGEARSTPLTASSLGRVPAGRDLKLLTTGENPPFAASRLPEGGWRRRLPAPGFLHGAPVVIYQPGSPVWIEARGFRPLVHPAADRPDAQGTLNPAQELWRPSMVLPHLYGKTVVIDPAGGGTQEEGRFPMGGRGSDLNLETARQLKVLLEGAGARVLLTRSGETALDPRGKVLLEKDNRADLFLTIGRTGTDQPAHVAHHHGSARGRIWAAALADLMDLEIRKSYAYLLRHTSCPALEVRLPSPKDVEQEYRLSSAAWQMAQARGLFLACAAALDPAGVIPPRVDPGEILARVLPAGLDHVDRVVWDGNFPWRPPTWQTDPHALTSCPEPGWPAAGQNHILEVHRAGSWQLWMVETGAGQYTSELLMENR